MARRHPNLINVEEAAVIGMAKGSRFNFKMKRLGKATGGKGIGCSWMEVPVGKSAFPRHFHYANEESIFILEGEGELQLGDQTLKVGTGDYVTFPTGPNGAHRLSATGDRPLRYLSLSTLISPEVVGYPDSNKIGAVHWTAGSEQPDFRGIFPKDATVDYYDGEITN